MDFIQALILGLVQGLTEFLPISSSAHLILVPLLTDWEDQGILYDIAVHAGSLGAVILYFRQDLIVLVRGWLATFTESEHEKNYLLWYIALATLPVLVSGLLFHDLVASTLRNPTVIALASIVFGLVLWWADTVGVKARDHSTLNWRDALVVGLAQALAIIPGTSRSGITITAGLLLGLDRQSASRFSFYMAIPVILGAVSYELLNLSIEGLSVDWLMISTVTLTAFFSAWLSIHFFLKLLNKTGMLPYVIYRVLLGVLLLSFF